MSRFEDDIATRKRVQRKTRQQFLFEQISQYRMAYLPFAEAYTLFQFFALAEPSESQLAEATRIIQEHIADQTAFVRELNELSKNDT